MTPDFNDWWDSNIVLPNNPYRESPIFWAWEGYNAALRDSIVACEEEARYENGQGAAACLVRVRALLPD